MSSEIEIQLNADHAAAGNGNKAVAGGGEAEEEISKDDVYTAAAYGDLEKLRNFVETEGCSIDKPDNHGYRALQWAALNNRVAAARFILKCGADVNAMDVRGQTALHWSAVRGANKVADLLLEEGARISATDVYGYQTTHIAVQYGHIAYLFNIITKWNADPDIPDNDGRSPLHWAAYKGFSNCTRLLLFLNAHRGRLDNEGCTPLHWAAIKGNLEACAILVQAGKKDDLIVSDKTGFTPTQLAADRNHTKVASFLRNSRKHYEGTSGKPSNVKRPPALVFIIFVPLLTYINSVVLASNFPNLTAGLAFFAWIGVALTVAGLIPLLRCSYKDPGYIKVDINDSKDTRDEEPLLKTKARDPALVAGNWIRLCGACKIVRPIGAKHCDTCDRCVEESDHHCPLVSNCIGKKNKWDFLVFLLLEILAMVMTATFSLTRIVRDPLAPSSFWGWLQHVGAQHLGVLFFLVSNFFLFGVAVLTVIQIYEEEMQNMRKKHSMESMSDKSILKKVFGQKFVRLFRCGCDTVVVGNTASSYNHSNDPT